MRGRIFTIKKSSLILSSAIINAIMFLGGSLFFALVFQQYNTWFFVFCINVGLHLIIKGMLLKYDSSCYFGILLFFVGLFYIYCVFLNLFYFYPVFVFIAFAIASYITFYYFSQPFHFILALSLFFVAIGLLFFLLNKISIWFFLAIVVVSVLLLIVRYFTLK